MIVADAAYVVTAAAGVGVTAVAVRYDRDVLGGRSFAWFLGLLGVWSVVCGVGALTGVFPSPRATPDVPGVVFMPAVAVATTTVPLLLFALQYTGRITRPDRRLVGLLAVMLAVFAVWAAAVWGRSGDGVGTVILVGASIGWSLPSLAFVAVAVYMLVDAVDGTVLGWTEPIAVIVPAVTINTIWRVINYVYHVGSESAVALTVAVPPAATLLVTIPLLARQDPFETLPAVGRRGRRTAVRETDDLVVVADDDDTIVEVNAAAEETLREAALGETTVADVLGETASALSDAETVTLDGRAYDPQVSWLSDHRDRRLGAVVSLRDVTARESREQRLSVLNRVLRHNVRNQMDVIRAHAEVLDDEDHAAAIRETVDTVSKLGRDARIVARLADSETVPVRIDEVVDSVVADHCEGAPATATPDTAGAEFVGDDEPDSGAEPDERVATDGSDGSVGNDSVGDGATGVDASNASDISNASNATLADGVTVTTDVPSETVVTDERALRVALDSAIANAVEHADSRVTVDCRERETADGYVVSVADDGSGLPATERAALEVDRETQLDHATGLGLWKLRWAVEALGGTVSVSTDDGTTVSVTVPDRG